LVAFLACVVLCPCLARADPVPLGYLVWDVTSPGTSGEFDLVNQTGPNGSGDATWPVDTAVSFSSLSLTVAFSDGSSFTSNSYFQLSADGLSFDGNPIAIGTRQPTGATLLGVLGPLDVVLFDGQPQHLLSSFTASIAFRAGGLADGDLALVEAAAVSAVPEPGTASLLAAGLLPWAAGAFVRRRRSRVPKKPMRRARLVAATMLLTVVPAVPALAAVKLNAWSAPANGTAGTTYVNVTATGAPLAPNNLPQSVAVSFAESCGAAAVASVAPSSVISIAGSSVRIQARLPANLTARTYAVSVAGVTGSGAFASANCSLVNVSVPVDDWKPLIEGHWSLPAQTEGFQCRTILAQSDMDIVALRSVPDPYQTIVTVADSWTGPVNSDFGCNAGTLLKTGIFMAGPGTGELTLPPGVAMHVRPGQFVSINQHVVNDTDSDQSGSTLIQVRTGDPATITDEAELALGGTFLINIPSDGVRHTASGGCGVHIAQRVFALQPHLQATGVHVAFRHDVGNDGTPLVDADYSISSQFIYPVPTAQQTLAVGDRVVTTCSYVNSTGQTKVFGESALNEQCFVGMYRTPPYVPPDASSSLLACASGR
jgi:hypothetical protein